MFDFAKARENMVDGQIHTAGVVDPRILTAFETTPRELFVPETRKTLAYYDEDMPVGDGRYLMEPVAHARMIEALDLGNDETVLDIGSATGYSAAILAQICATVVALDEDKKLLEQAERNWTDIELHNIVSVHGTLSDGAPDMAPFEYIFVGGACAEVPQALVNQLKPGGRMVVVIKKDPHILGEACLVQRNDGHINKAGKSSEDAGFSIYSLFSVGCHYLPGFAPKESFSF